MESSLSSDEEEEVARGSEERDCQGDEDNEECRGEEAQELARQGLVHLQPAVADLLVRFLHCTSGKEKFL